MGNFCSGCYPTRHSSSLPRGESGGAQYSLTEVAEEVQPRCHIQRSYSTSQSNLPRSETLSLLGGPQAGTSSSLKSEKKSLASKLSGTLNRTNSGEQSGTPATVLVILSSFYLQSLNLSLRPKLHHFMRSTRMPRMTAYYPRASRSSV